MKTNRLIIVLIAMCTFILPGYSQIKVGIKGGMVMTDLSFKNVSDNFKTSNRAGFEVGPVVDFKIPILGLGLDAAVLYSHQTANVERGNNSKNIRQSGIDIPINLKYNFGLSSILGLYLAAGPDFFFNLSKSQKIDDVRLKKENARIGINVGGGITLFKHLQVGAAYNFPLNKSGKNNEENLSFKTKSWQLSATYFF